MKTKNFYLIGGTMGVGKTAISQELKKKAENAVLLDGDWCWDADPFQVTEETLRERLQKDVSLGRRTPDIIDRSLSRIPLYRTLDTEKITTDRKNVSEIADEILSGNHQGKEEQKNAV